MVPLFGGPEVFASGSNQLLKDSRWVRSMRDRGQVGGKQFVKGTVGKENQPTASALRQPISGKQIRALSN